MRVSVPHSGFKLRLPPYLLRPRRLAGRHLLPATCSTHRNDAKFGQILRSQHARLSVAHKYRKHHCLRSRDLSITMAPELHTGQACIQGRQINDASCQTRSPGPIFSPVASSFHPACAMPIPPSFVALPPRPDKSPLHPFSQRRESSRPYRNLMLYRIKIFSPHKLRPEAAAMSITASPSANAYSATIVCPSGSCTSN